MATTNVHISAVPQSIHDKVAEDVLLYSVGLNFIYTEEGREQSRFVGSGTLVRLGSIEGILTADHVVTALEKCESLGVMCEVGGHTRRHAIPKAALQFHRVAKHFPDCRGPDLGFIELPAQGIGYIRSEKVFFNIEKRKELYEGSFEPLENGFWFYFGVIGETRQGLGRVGPFEVQGYQALCGMSCRPTETVKDEYDYLSIEVDWEGRESDIPRSFGGMSGGGVWQSIMAMNQTGEIRVERTVLSGVVFCESAVINGKLTLKCHGRRSAYRNLEAYFASLGRYA